MEIDCQSVHQRLESGEEFVLLDCREPNEFEFVSISGAMLLPMSELPTRLDELSPFRDSAIVVYCHHGVRSLQVAHWLQGQGFGRTVSMSGGIDRWAVEIDRSLPRY